MRSHRARVATQYAPAGALRVEAQSGAAAEVVPRNRAALSLSLSLGRSEGASKGWPQAGMDLVIERARSLAEATAALRKHQQGRRALVVGEAGVSMVSRGEAVRTWFRVDCDRASTGGGGVIYANMMCSE